MVLIFLSITICLLSTTDGRTLVNSDHVIWPTQEECSMSTNYRIIGGKVTELGEYPFAVLLHSGTSFYCGGSLINNWYVLTAAHCFRRKPDFIRLGEWKISTDQDCDPDEEDTCSDPVKDVQIERVIIHENYDASNYENDIALVKLKNKIEYTDWIRPVCLPRSKEERQNVMVGRAITVMGWGFTNETQKSDVLLKANIEIYKNNYCHEKLRTILETSQFCAGSQDGRDSCPGDSGGPTIVVPGRRRYYLQTGIVSSGPLECGMKGFPAVYTNVVALMDWIDEKVEVSPKPANDIKSEIWPSKQQCKSQSSPLGPEDPENADLGEYPFMANLLRDERIVCGAVLISNRYVLTTVNCARRATTVTLGEWKLSTRRDCDDRNHCSDPIKEIKVESVTVHPNYDRIAHENDIALIRLAERVEYTRWISPVCLPDQQTLTNLKSQTLTAMGWASKGSNTSVKYDVLQTARLNVLDQNICNNKYGVELLESQLCLGSYDSTDTCTGQSGSPVIIESTTSLIYNMLIGLVSAGHKICGTEGFPGLYTNVASFKDWIEENVIM